MALKYIPGKGTGIYKSGRWKPTEPADMYELARRITESMSLEKGCLRLAESAALSTLKRHGVRTFRRPKKLSDLLKDYKNADLGLDTNRDVKVIRELSAQGIRWAGNWALKLPKEIPDQGEGIVHDAQEVLWQVLLVRESLKEGNLENTAVHAVRLGAWVESMGVRPFEPHAMRGRKVQEGGRKGHEERYGTVDEKLTERGEWQKFVNESHAERPDKPYRSHAIKAASQFGVSERTIRKHTKNPKSLLK